MITGALMNSQHNRQRGFSLAEVLVALAIFAIIFLAALTAYDRSNRVFKTGVESSNMQQNTRVAFDKLVSDVRMAGYDFDRDGIPTGSVGGVNLYQQPDEQFEYIGPSAITIRSNLDYETENAPCAGAVTDNCDNGREKIYENAQFPVVTTGNDEIVTYALVPDSQVAPPVCDPATNCVQFYADTYIPRRSYPDPANGGLSENVVEIRGVDLCVGGCNNPPYTLHRFTLDRTQQNFAAGANVIDTPLATNIRSMTFKYYQDAQGTDPLKDLPNTTDVSTGATIKGIGQYDVSNPSALVPQRDIRGKINSVRLTLIGMNESRDFAFTDTAETVTGGPGYFEQYRKYRLETLISPRNIQKRGMREQDTYPPGAPTITATCTGACAGVYLEWAAPSVSSTQGAPDQYKVIYDTVASTGFNCETTTFTNTYTHVFGTTPACKLIPNVPYKFAVVALNSYGSMTSGTVQPITPLNATKPSEPLNVTTTLNQNGKVTLTWDRPKLITLPGGYSCGPTTPNAAELQGYLVERESPAGSGTFTALVTAPNQVTTYSPYDTVTWTDTTVTNCVDYNYRVYAVESCYFDPNYNSPTTVAVPPPVCPTAACGAYGISPPSSQKLGRGTTTFAPSAPGDFQVDQDPVNSPCAGGYCQPHMYWPVVNTDTAPAPPAPIGPPPGNPITIDTYIVERMLVGSGVWAAVKTLNNPPVNASGKIEWIDDSNGGLGVPTASGETYRYRVKAHGKCPTPFGTDSAPSIDRSFPCAFAALATGTPLLLPIGVFDGDGSAANPWKVDSTAGAMVNVLDPTKIARVVGRDYLGAAQLWQAQCPAPPCSPVNPPYTFSWTIAPNQIERLDVAVVDNSAQGCTEQTFAYFQDEPQSCCLTPITFDPTVVNLITPNDFIDVYLKNRCSVPLIVNSIRISWTPPGGAPPQKLDRVLFPAFVGQTPPALIFDYSPDTTASPVSAGSPIGTATVPGESAISSTANNGAGRIRVTTATPHGLLTNNTVSIQGHNASTNGTWVITVVSPTVFDLNGSSFAANAGAVGTVTPNYFIRLKFTRSITNPVSFITGLRINYTNATGTTDCPIQ
jgi:prepilin-type N-terminal cleavage/methylation domain-containing protein